MHQHREREHFQSAFDREQLSPCSLAGISINSEPRRRRSARRPGAARLPAWPGSGSASSRSWPRSATNRRGTGSPERIAAVPAMPRARIIANMISGRVSFSARCPQATPGTAGAGPRARNQPRNEHNSDPERRPPYPGEHLSPGVTGDMGICWRLDLSPRTTKNHRLRSRAATNLCTPNSTVNPAGA